MPSFSDWYSQQYSAWNRTRRLRATPYLARTDTNTSRRATAIATGTENQPSTTTGVEAVSTEPQTEKRPETLFGPNIGIVSEGPAWAQSEDAKKGTPSDYLTPEIVRRWVETSKDTIQPTTTLQALVNLKRPTLKLSPVTLQPSEDPSEDPVNAESHNNHALEFEYDCDAPKCSITVQVIVSNHSSPSENLDRITVYEAVTEGGFGRLLTLEDCATIELGRFEYMGQSSPVADADKTPKVNKTVVTTEVSEVSEGPTQTIVTPAPAPTFENQENARKRRFVALHFRRRAQNQSVSGPALAVLDNDAAAATEEGVRIAIRLVALDELGKELLSVNRQMTYLHVIRFGPPVTDGEDNRPWVVKVVKREATIGSHTFHLHEIYGLSSTSTSAQLTTAPDATPTVAHTYPPTVPVPPAEDEPSSECLVCLSSPREVVLLPCRHLVACKECAINMVEFGAGGAITHAEEPATTADAQPAEAADAPPTVDDSALPASTEEEASGPAAAATGGDEADRPSNPPATDALVEPVGDSSPESSSSPPPPTASATSAQATPNVIPIAPVPPNPRRKRRAKGWFCPVCRQPYTSLLRITTTPPTMEDTKEGKRVSTSTMDHPLANAAPADQAAARLAMAPEPVPEEAVPTPSRSLRPVFLQRLQRRTTDASSPV
ncbi:hypothetical protein EDB92DRAFT_1095118 [Lactarius akahatsu]|uniref:RING-type domain-containing protein n=1 Tax=Lactarius akahatsu TaxID=416441 RepID=A0AAD4LDH8_9AGAM|nr:hypothetical protein EDB92DRAFT_1095118 [Lactarius akahatsu]